MKFKDKLQVKITSEFKGEVWHFKLMKINRYKNSEIGKLEVDFAREKKYFVISSHVDLRYRNKGFGKLLYEKALKKFQSLGYEVNLHILSAGHKIPLSANNLIQQFILAI